MYFTDHMAVATWTAADGWHDSAIVPYGRSHSTLRPPCCTTPRRSSRGSRRTGTPTARCGPSVLTRTPNEWSARLSGWPFRRCRPKTFSCSIDELVAADIELGANERPEQSLYLRPFMFATEAFLGVRPAKRVTYCCIASPAGSYFASGVQPISIWISTLYSRSAPGGTGAAKCGGNYAASLLPQQEAFDHGCDQVMFADAAEHCWLEELGGMNVYLITTDNELITPELTGSILEGVTRDSILTLAAEFGLTPVERRIGIDELLDGIGSGKVTELFACGTAAVVNSDRHAEKRDGQLPGRLGCERRDHPRDSSAAAGHPVRPCGGQVRLAPPRPLTRLVASGPTRRHSATTRRTDWQFADLGNTVGMQFLVVIIC